MNKINLLIAALAFSVSHSALAASGSSPNGKPFVAIGDQIVEVQGSISSLQDQIDVLVGRVDTIEQRLAANETAILDLQDQNGVLQALIDTNASSITDIQTEIDALQVENQDLLTQINTNQGDIILLQSQVNANEALISTLQAAISAVQNDLITLGSGLQAQIDNNEQLIAILQSELDAIEASLALKQAIVTGNCPAGFSIRQINADGTVVCEFDNVGGGSGTLSVVAVFGSAGFIAPGHFGHAIVPCPGGFLLTGGGYHGFRFSIIDNRSLGNSWFVQGQNQNPFSTDLVVEARCARIVP